MEWWIVILVFLGILISLLMLGMPVAFGFLCANFITVGWVFGLSAGFEQLVLSIYDAVTKFTLTPVPAFILMGQLLFRSGLATQALDVMSMWLGRLPGRLSLLAVGSGTLFATLSGSNIANTSMLGSLLVPDMRRRGYHTRMATGPIMASGTLAMLIPPSAVAVLLGSIGDISIGALLIAGIIPGLLMACIFAAYITCACLLKPSLAPPYEVGHRVSFATRSRLLVTKVAPLLGLIALVVGLIFAGLATPTEAAALGAVGAFILVVVYRRISKQVIVDTATGSLRTTGMILLIFAFAAGFSQLLAFTGATRELISLVAGWGIPPNAIVLVMLLLVVMMGSFLDLNSIMLITLPLFMPVIEALELNPVWFGVMMLIALDMGNLTPPFGINLFVLKGVSPPDVSMGAIYGSAVPFIALDVLVIALIWSVPSLATWLPSVSAS